MAFLTSYGYRYVPPRQISCQRRHPFEGDNVYVRPDGTRNCRACASYCRKRSRAAAVARGENPYWRPKK